MILPIYAYGHPILRKVGQDITPDYPQLSAVISNMWETMYHTRGMGLAAPQIGLAIRLFIIDTVQLDAEDRENAPTAEFLKQVFINPEIIEEAGKEWAYEEGCLSIPEVRGKVNRPAQVRIQYLDENFQKHDKIYDGMTARVIQHEYDHIEGILFTDHLGMLKKQLVSRRLNQISRGEYRGKYKMVFA
jgi:peptide deformylase